MMGRRSAGATVCLDRNGTLNLRWADHFEILPKFPVAVRLVRDRG